MTSDCLASHLIHAKAKHDDAGPNAELTSSSCCNRSQYDRPPRTSYVHACQRRSNAPRGGVVVVFGGSTEGVLRLQSSAGGVVVVFGGSTEGVLRVQSSAGGVMVVFGGSTERVLHVKNTVGEYGLRSG